MPAAESTFLFPRSRQFPFDEVCEQIVRALDARSWSVPGITVKFRMTGHGDAKYRVVDEIRGNNFRLMFGRLSPETIAEVVDIIIPGRHLSVYCNEGGPHFYVYVGGAWEHDREWFMATNHKSNAWSGGEPRRYLYYEGGCRCPKGFQGLTHIHTGHRAPLLVHSTDHDRQYQRQDTDPESYSTEAVFAEFRTWLSNLLAMFLQISPTDPSDYLPPSEFFREHSNPWTAALTDQLGPIFCFGLAADADRILRGKQSPNTLEPWQRYGFTADWGGRLLSWSNRSDNPPPNIAYETFLWAGFGSVKSTDPISTLFIPGFRRDPEHQYVFRIRPDRTDGIYVADQMPPNDQSIASDKADLARARTIMPALDYALTVRSDPSRAYTQPIILFRREVDLDEVELVSGPWAT